MEVYSTTKLLVDFSRIVFLLSCVVRDNKAYGLYRKENADVCNIFAGNWVHDQSYPLYDGSKCQNIRPSVNCVGNGRPDSDYQKWRWQPRSCDIPRFNARDMLERLRGKRLMFVGDSITQNQFYSMMCLLQTISRDFHLNTSSTPTTFVARDFNASVEFFWASYLVDVDTNEQKQDILHVDRIENNGMHWKGVDILVFETSHWWPERAGSVKRWEILMVGNETRNDMDPIQAYSMALTTWSHWMASNIDFTNTQVFYRTMSLRHGPGCENATEPLKTIKDDKEPPHVAIAHKIVREAAFPVAELDITNLTAYRRDAHPSWYGVPPNKREAGGRGDCSHWCLAGVPDAWNQLLYAKLLSP